VLLVIVGYLLLIRPARRRAQAAAALQAAISPGNEVMLSSGLFGTVVDIQDEVARVELSPGVVVRVHRGAVTKIIKEPFSTSDRDDEEPGSAGRTPDDDDAGVN
jgi:preprotein translocase subunit YajC